MYSDIYVSQTSAIKGNELISDIIGFKFTCSEKSCLFHRLKLIHYRVYLIYILFIKFTLIL